MSSMPMMSAAMTIPTMVAMMVAMMLPSVAPDLWRYHRHQHATIGSRAGGRTALFAAGYAGVWAAISVALFSVHSISPTRVASSMNIVVPPWAAGAIVLCAGALQCSRWKAKRLYQCRALRDSADGVAKTVIASLRDGCQLGVQCCLSCAAPMTMLLVGGLMDERMMALIATAITAERVAPAGVRIARLTGGLALVAGAVLCIRPLR